ncbi:MAG TPA: hypothetical protein VE820_07110 [Sphingomicrobium sp.]|nr:hypothetical protein [Sphingomicrobium sp.]
MLRFGATFALVAASASFAAPIPVTITGAAQEQQARRLESAVRKELMRDRRFILVDRPAPGAFNIALPAGVGWERRLDWTEIYFQARLNTPSGQSHVLAGRCYNWSMSVCAKQILDSAAQAAGN